jgi:hypothetical protein
LEKQQDSSSEIKVMDFKPSLNVKIPKNSLLISYISLFLSLIVWGLTLISESPMQRLFFCFIGSILFSIYLFLEYISYFLYIHWKQKNMINKLRNPLLVTLLQIYYYLWCFTIAWISYTFSGEEFPELLFYLIVLFLPVFVGKGSVRIQRVRDIFIDVSSIELSR